MRNYEYVVIVIYDIQDNKKRSRAQTICKDFGLRSVQYSVFCGSLTIPKINELFARLVRYVGKESSHIWVIQLERQLFSRILVHGEPLSIHQYRKEAVRIYG